MPAVQPTCRFKAVTIFCTDRHRSAAFYEEALGAVLDRREHDYCLWYRLGSTWITLVPNAEVGSPARMPEHAMASLWVETDDLAAAVERFAALGVDVLQPSDGQMTLIADPDGIVIEVWQGEQNGSSRV